LLFPVYQPIVDVRDGSIFGFEANVRGKDANGKIVRYEQLRESNLYPALDYVARDIALINFRLKHYKLFVNVAPEELDKPLFSEDLELNNVVLEITEESSESTNLDLDRLEKKLNKLRDNGLEIALDDFGSQRQNYDRITRYSPTFLKLDKSIVKDNMLGNFVNLIHQHQVIVEGIETKEQLNSCINLGFHYVQGYYLSNSLDSDTLKTDLINHDLQINIQENLALKKLVTP
jgi:EAL domain-containing protein (putative c-di-GMP-specific phosphodiesterase class I)